jgi:hypothetical protein
MAAWGDVVAGCWTWILVQGYDGGPSVGRVAAGSIDHRGFLPCSAGTGL